MGKAVSDSKKIDVPIVSHYLDDVDPQELWDIYAYASITADFTDNCNILLENYNRRNIQKQAQKVAILSSDTSFEYMSLIAEASKVADVEEIETTNQLLPWVIDTVERLFDKHESLMVSDDTGYKTLNEMIGWWRAWSLYIVWARPSVGKSTFAINLLAKLWEQGIKTALFSTEMPPKEIHVRMLSMIAQVESWMIEKGFDSVTDKVTDAVTRLTEFAECNIYNQFTNVSLERLISKEATQGTKVIFIDYLQNVKIEGKYWNRNDAIGAITAMLKAMALKYEITVVCLAQLNRQMQEGEEPQLSHLRDSWNIEQDADVVMFLEGYDAHNQEINIYLKKNRHGELGKIVLKYIKQYFTFLNRF